MDKPHYLWTAEGLLSMIALLLAMLLLEFSLSAGSRLLPLSLLVSLAVIVLVLGRLLFSDEPEGAPADAEAAEE